MTKNAECYAATGLENVISIVDKERPTEYKGIDKNILLILENKQELQTVKKALNKLRAESPKYYKKVEKCVDKIKTSKSEIGTQKGNTIYIPEKILNHGRARTIIVLVHEAKHIGLESQNLASDYEEHLCFIEEKECLETLGSKLYGEAEMGVDLEAYIGSRIVQWKMYKAQRNEESEKI
ncbi:hypothetical protein HOK51_02970 [Candidatus Woesearchaeota archaeon]|jgi:hypothetical protein|nr:hypothetical protein [Candidatus Woesearchaeota archaeon]MBT6518780.1 hypothetical protein [Candidatus Woesearchaeota archaeon]MBT7366918.1 hypothetical protein [Candidatus Woesearchaeota archaeon]